MSQHHFNSTLSGGESVCVLAGWDRPLQQYFLVAMSDDPKSNVADEEGIVYSNLYDIEAPDHDWDYFMQTLAQKGISAPDGLAQALLIDKECNAGNVVTAWNEQP